MKKLFINRKSELKYLTEGLKRGNDYILVAPRRFGKTALAVKVLEAIRQDSDYIVIDIDLMTYSGGSVRGVAECIIEKTLNALGFEGKLRRMWRQVNMSFSMKVTYQELEIEPLFNMFREGDEWALLEEVLNLAEKVALKHKKRVVVFYDEFGELYSLGERVIKMFRSVLQRHTEVSYLFAGSQETVMNQIFLDKSGAFYRFGELIYLKELNNQDVYTFIAENYIKPDETGLRDFRVIDELLGTLKGHPYYTAQVVEFFETRPNCDIEALYHFIHDDLYERERPYLELQLLQIKQRQYAIDVLRVIAMELSPYSELKTITRQRVNQILRYLENAGYVRKEARGVYVITDPMLAILLVHD